MTLPHANIRESREPSRAGWRKSIAVAALLLAGSTVPALADCAGAALPAAPAQLQRTELFLGLSLAGGSTIGPRAWARFEREVLGPQLCGYTVIDARGGWIGANGRLVHEPAKMVIVIHRPDALPTIESVAKTWRERFGQEAVLRATQSVEGGLIQR